MNWVCLRCDWTGGDAAGGPGDQVRACRALAHAHAHQVIHRRVEPESVVIAADGVTRLGRFDLAKLQSVSNTIVSSR